MKKAVKALLENLLFLFVIAYMLSLFILYFLRSNERTALRYIIPTESPKQVATLGGFFDGSFQKKWEDWFNENFSGHADAVKLHDRIEYSFFCDGVDGWLQGKDGCLFSSASSYYSDGPFAFIGQQSDYDEYAQKVLQLQSNLAGLGKEFVYLLTPIKAEIYPDKLPWNERIVAARYASKGPTMRDAMIDAFNRFGVHYYDMTPDLRQMRESNPDFEVFATTGHHWSVTAVAKEMEALFQAMSRTTPPRLIPKLSVTGLSDQVFDTDRDIFYAFQVDLDHIKTAHPYRMPVIAYEEQSDADVYLFGTSMGIQIGAALYTSASQRAFKSLVYSHYFTTIYSYDENGSNRTPFTIDTKPEDENILQHIKDSDLVLMESQPLTGILDTHIKFLDYVNENIDKIEHYNLEDNLIRYTPDLSGARLEGFHDLEDWGRWTSGRTCSFYLNGNALKAIAGDAVISTSLRSYAGDQDVGVVFNGEQICTLHVTPDFASFAVPIPESLIQENENVIQLTIDGHVYTPKELNYSADLRYFGLGIESLTVKAGE